MSPSTCDTLEAVGRSTEYPARQARVASIGFAVALVLAVVQLVVAFRLAEAEGHGRALGSSSDGNPAVATEALLVGGLSGQLRRSVGSLQEPFLAWIFAYGVTMVTLEHVAASVLQPWLTELNDGTATDIGATPLLSGVVFAVVALVGAVAARSSDPLARRFGVVPTLLGLGVLSAVIVASMAIWVAPAVLLLVAFRSAQGAAAPVLISDAISRRVERQLPVLTVDVSLAVVDLVSTTARSVHRR